MNFKSFLLMYIYGKYLIFTGKKVAGHRKCYFACKWLFDEEEINFNSVRLLPNKNMIPRPRVKKKAT